MRLNAQNLEHQMTNAILKTEHRGAQIALHYEMAGAAKLYINGLLRAQAIGHADINLESVVQTDYEWHEQVAGHCGLTSAGVSLTLYMSKTLIASKNYPREAAP